MKTIKLISGRGPSERCSGQNLPSDDRDLERHLREDPPKIGHLKVVAATTTTFAAEEMVVNKKNNFVKILVAAL